MHYITIPLEDCQTTSFFGHNLAEQWAYTAPGERPSGAGWADQPQCTFDQSTHEPLLLWRRPWACAQPTPLAPPRLATLDEGEAK